MLDVSNGKNFGGILERCDYIITTNYDLLRLQSLQKILERKSQCLKRESI